MSYENQPVNIKQRILFMGLILTVMGIVLYVVLTAEGIAPKDDSSTNDVVIEGAQSNEAADSSQNDNSSES